jgi:hypothetical protein
MVDVIKVYNKYINKLDTALDDGLLIECISNTNEGIYEFNITHDQFITKEQIINLIPNEWSKLEKSGKIKITITGLDVKTYYFY